MEYLKDRLPELEPVIVGPRFAPTLNGLIAWLETQPRETRFDSTDVKGCVFVEFARAAGLPVAGRLGLPVMHEDSRNLWRRLAIFSRTYGAVLRKAKRLVFWRNVRAFLNLK